MEISKLTYEESILELEKILSELEGDEYTLEESIARFKKGMDLYNHSSKLLSKAEGEIKILLKDEEGTLKEEEFMVEG